MFIHSQLIRKKLLYIIKIIVIYEFLKKNYYNLVEIMMWICYSYLRRVFQIHFLGGTYA